MSQHLKVMKAVFSCIAFFVFIVLQSGRVMAQSEMLFSDIPNRKSIETFDRNLFKSSRQFVDVYEFDSGNKILYRCLGRKKALLKTFRCSKAEPAKRFYVPDAVIKRWKSLTGGEVASLNNFTILPLTNIPEPYKQSAHSLILWNKSADQIWVCRYIRNDYEFEAPIDGITVYFFSPKQPEIHEFCQPRYPRDLSTKM